MKELGLERDDSQTWDKVRAEAKLTQAFMGGNMSAQEEEEEAPQEETKEEL